MWTYCHMFEWLLMGFGLEMGFIDLVQIITTSNYNAVTNLHTLQITTAHTKPSQSGFTSRFSVIDRNSGDSSANLLMSLLSGKYPTTELNFNLVPLITSWHRLHREHRFQPFLYCCGGLVAVGTCLFWGCYQVIGLCAATYEDVGV
jgi:hypothetical protein